jgi:hypothetical protein
MPDAVSLAFDPGMYSVSFLDPAYITCMGALAGKESDFAGMTHVTTGLIDGTVTFDVTATQLSISGSPIQSGFPQSTLALMFDPTSQPPVWAGGVTGQFAIGPDGTRATFLGLAVDATTAHASSGIQGAYAELFNASTATGTCSVSFGALFVRS